MSRFTTYLASILLSAVFLIAAQSLPTPYLNNDRKADHVADATSKAVENWNVWGSIEWRRAYEAKYGKTTVLPTTTRQRRVRIPPWRVKAALRSGNVEALAADVFVGVYTVPVSSKPRGPPPEATRPTMFDIM